MSYYDDASIMFIGGAATGADGKAGTAKPINGGSPLYVTRGSNLTATRVNSSGLIEKGRENLLLKSNLFDNGGVPPSSWSTSNASVSSGQSGYDGSSDAWLLSKSAASGRIWQSITSVSGVQTFSAYVKANASTWGLLQCIGGSNPYAYFDLGTGVVGSIGGGTISNSIEDVGGGWYRISFIHNTTISSARIYPAEANTASGTSGSIYIQDAQLEIGLAATEYIESGASTGKAGLLENEPRYNYSIGGSVPHLLLEPQRTNSVSNSEYLQGNSEFKVLSSSVTFADYTETSPEGNTNALRILEAEGTGNHNWYYDNLGTFVNGTTYTFSFFAKSIRGRNIRFDEGGVGMNMQGIINLSDGSILQDTHSNVSVESYGNGWYRISAVGTMNGTAQRIIFNTTDGTNTSFAGDTTSGVSLWGVQIEEGSYPTSYIPNHSGGSVSRESESVTTASVPSLINQNEGVFFVDFEFLDGQNETINWFGLHSADYQERVLIYKTSNDNHFKLYLKANALLIVNHITNVTISPNTRYKVAFRYSTGSQAIYINGSLVHSSTNTYTRGSDLSRVTFNESNQSASCRVHETIVFQSGWDNVDLEILTGATPYQSFESMAATLNYTVYE